jgi:hypothetical protein
MNGLVDSPIGQPLAVIYYQGLSVLIRPRRLVGSLQLTPVTFIAHSLWKKRLARHLVNHVCRPVLDDLLVASSVVAASFCLCARRRLAFLEMALQG